MPHQREYQSLFWWKVRQFIKNKCVVRKKKFLCKWLTKSVLVAQIPCSSKQNSPSKSVAVTAEAFEFKVLSLIGLAVIIHNGDHLYVVTRLIIINVTPKDHFVFEEDGFPSRLPTLLFAGEGHGHVWTVLLWTSEAVQSDQALTSFKIRLPPCSKERHGCEVCPFPELLDFSCDDDDDDDLSSPMHAPSCFQWIQRSGGPVHLLQRAIATLPPRAGEGRSDVAVS